MDEEQERTCQAKGLIYTNTLRWEWDDEFEKQEKENSVGWVAKSEV